MTKMETSQKTSFRIAVLSLSLLTIMSGAGVAPGINKIAEAFPDTSETVIKLIISLPPLFMIIAALLSGFIGKFIKHKTLIIFGLVLFIIGGVGAGYMHTIPQILLFRAILGFGTGIILPFSIGLIAAFFVGNERSKMMGYSSATNCLGAIIGNILAGILAVVGWSQMFHIYWLGALVLLCVLLFLNHLPENKQSKVVSQAKLPGSVFLYSFFAFLTMMVFFLIVTNMAFFVHLRELGSSKNTGYLFALNSLAMLVAGIMLPLLKKSGKMFLPGIFLLVSLGLFGIAKSVSLPVLCLSVFGAGFGLGALFPYLLNRISYNVPKELSVKAMSIGMASAWFGQFASPLIFGGIAAIIGLNMISVFLSVSAIVAIFALIVLFRQIRTITL